MQAQPGFFDDRFALCIKRLPNEAGVGPFPVLNVKDFWTVVARQLLAYKEIVRNEIVRQARGHFLSRSDEP